MTTRHPDVRVRPATPDDLRAVLLLRQDVAAKGWLSDLAPDAASDDRLAYEERLADPASLMLVAADEDAIVGFLRLLVNEGLADLAMFVAAAHRGQGIGTSLLDHAIRWARASPVHKITLEVWPHNSAAINLYTSNGFEIEGTLRRHRRRRNGELWDAVIMGLVLDTDSPAGPQRADPGGTA